MKKISMPKKEFVKEHKRLIGVLRSPSHKDDKKEAEDQAKELKEHTEKSDIDMNRRDRIIATKKQMKKSVDFKDTLVSVDAQDQMLAEKTTSPTLIKYIQYNMDANNTNKVNTPAKIPFPTGILTLSARETGIYNGFFQDNDGQVVEKFDAQTAAIIAKTLQLKSLVPEPVEAQPCAPSVPASEQQVQMLAAAHDRIDMTHNRIDELQRQLIEQQRGKSIRIKYGDFELEIKKSVQDFIGDFKAGRTTPDKDVVRKAITSWRKKNAAYLPVTSDQLAARELMDNWDQHQDGFCQFVDAISRGDDEQD